VVSHQRIQHGLALTSVTLVLCVLWAASLFAQDPIVSVSERHITPDQTVRLEIRIESDGRVRFGDPRGSDFATVSQSTQTSATFINGVASSHVTRVLELRPTRTGELTIGAVEIRTSSGVRHTDPITIRVDEEARVPTTPRGEEDRPAVATRPPGESSSLPSDPSTPPSLPNAGSSEMFVGPYPQSPGGQPFIQARITTPEPYAGQVVVVDYVLFSPAMALGLDATDMSEPDFVGMWFDDMTQARTAQTRTHRLGTVNVGGELYDTQIIRSYAVVPLNPGEFIIPPLELDIVMRGFYRDQGHRKIGSRPLRLTVREPPPSPDGMTAATNVGRFTMRTTIEPAELRVGDTATLTIDIRGVGLASRIRGPILSDTSRYRVSEPRDSASMGTAHSGWPEAHVRRTFFIVPKEEGVIELPELAFTFFDPFGESYATVTAQTRQITVRGTNPDYVSGASEAETAAGRTWLDGLPSERELPEGRAEVTAFAITPVYLAFAMAPPLAYGLFLFGAFLVRTRAARLSAQEDATNAASIAKRIAALDGEAPSTCAEVATLLRRFIATRLDVAARACTIRELRTACAAKGDPTHLRALVDLIEEAELARYSGAAQTSEIISKAQDLLAALPEDA